MTIQIMGGDMLPKVREYKAKGASLIPVSVAGDNTFIKLFDEPKQRNLEDKDFPMGWVNFYRQDDVSTTAYFYLDKPTSQLPALAPVADRVINAAR